MFGKKQDWYRSLAAVVGQLVGFTKVVEERKETRLQGLKDRLAVSDVSRRMFCVRRSSVWNKRSRIDQVLAGDRSRKRVGIRSQVGHHAIATVHEALRAAIGSATEQKPVPESRTACSSLSRPHATL